MLLDVPGMLSATGMQGSAPMSKFDMLFPTVWDLSFTVIVTEWTEGPSEDNSAGPFRGNWKKEKTNSMLT